MAVPTDKGTLLVAVGETYQTMMAEYQAMPSVAVRAAQLAGHVQGTVISGRDLAVYLLGWNCLVLKWLAQSETLACIVVAETGSKWNALCFDPQMSC
jgi:hypothetical protein